MAHRHDLVVRGGTLADGTGAPLREADVAVVGGRIAEVGRVAGSGREEIAAQGLLVTPGFVDIHTHYDGQVTWEQRLAPSSWHGVTTAVMGNCGVGFAPVRAVDRERLVELMEGVEDIPGAALHEGLAWTWESFAGYLDAVAARPHDIDIGAQLPHGALRVYVMGERGAQLEPATDADIAAMRRLAGDAIRAGALGFSTSRTLNHRSAKGEPTPSLRASEAELRGIVLGLADAGAGVVELITDWPDLGAEFAMIRRLVEASARPLTLSLAQSHASPDGWRKILGLIGRAAADGLPIKAQVAPRPIGTLLGLQSSVNPFSGHASFRAIAQESLAEKVAAFRDPGFRARLLSEEPAGGRGARFRDYERIFAWEAAPDYEPPRASCLTAMAVQAGRPAAELAADLLQGDDGRAFLFAPIANYAAYDLEACREMMADRHTVIGLGDGGAHVGIICDASFPTYALAHWGRDRAQGRFALPWLAQRLTADTARCVDLHDRGVVAPGMKADLNVIDFDRLALETPVMAFDLPAGGKRLLQRARGYAATIVSGEIVYREGLATGALPGRVIRGPQTALGDRAHE
jgi:N-acyl-D-aspartate/D-glutamate deacylase